MYSVPVTVCNSLSPPRRCFLPGVCLFVCLSVCLSVCLLATDRIFMKILPKMYLLPREITLNFGSRPHPNHKFRKLKNFVGEIAPPDSLLFTTAQPTSLAVVARSRLDLHVGLFYSRRRQCLSLYMNSQNSLSHRPR